MFFRQLRSLSENESDDPSSEKKEEFLSLPVTANLCPTLPPSPSTSSMSKSHKSNTLGGQRARSVIKSFSATGLSLMIPPGLYTMISEYYCKVNNLVFTYLLF